jgi:DNA-binding NarL/FixJ family response regulator
LPAVSAPELAGLSPAERVVAMQVTQGLSNKEIARALGKSECTVKNQVSAILRKLGVPTRARLMAVLRPGAGTSQGMARLH